MTPLTFTLITFAISIVAGLLGSLLGLGGGIIVVPALTLLLKIDIHHAIGASIVSVIATSSGAAAAYVRERMANMRVGMLLETSTATGALGGAYLAGILPGRWLFLIFGLLMGYTALSMLRKKKANGHLEEPPDALAHRLNMHGEYYDESMKQTVAYRVGRTRLGLAISALAGVLSGLLGIGGGTLKVPAMTLAMGMPIKAATATSNFMIGVTAAASAAVYFMRGDINPFIAAPVAAGVLIGATTGSRILGRLENRKIRIAFVIVLLITSAQMLTKGVRDERSHSDPASVERK
jgi:uncharacterized membrane protein YfcA